VAHRGLCAGTSSVRRSPTPPSWSIGGRRGPTSTPPTANYARPGAPPGTTPARGTIRRWPRPAPAWDDAAAAIDTTRREQQKSPGLCALPRRQVVQAHCGNQQEAFRDKLPRTVDREQVVDVGDGGQQHQTYRGAPDGAGTA